MYETDDLKRKYSCANWFGFNVFF